MKNQRLTLDGAQKKPLRLREFFREPPFAVGKRMFDQQLNRLEKQTID